MAKTTGSTTRTRTGGGTARTGTRAAAKPSGRASVKPGTRPRAAAAAGTATATVRRRTARTADGRSARGAGTARASRPRSGGGGVIVPVITPRLSLHRVQIPTFGLTELGGGLVAAAGRSLSGRLPSKERLGYYAGLGALAAAGLIEWPVAAAIGVGMAVARRTGGDRAEGRTEIVEEVVEERIEEVEEPSRSRPAARSATTRSRAAAGTRG